jgi:hypothetical protein
MVNILDLKLDDDDTERVRRSHSEAIKDLQRSLPRVIPNIALVDGKATTVAHGLGRAPRAVIQSIARGSVSAGFITETRPSGTDRSKTIVLQASGYGATITVDVVVLP